jgi:hypothetical protein
LNNLEIFNEFTFLALTYPILLFTGYMDADLSFQYDIGWLMILLIMTNFVVNLLVVFWEALKGFCIKCKSFNRRINLLNQEKKNVSGKNEGACQKIKAFLKEVKLYPEKIKTQS